MKSDPRSIPLDFILTLLTCGLWNMVVQKAQFEFLNRELKEERYSLFKTSVYCILTLMLYLPFLEYQKARDWERISGEQHEMDGILAILLSLFGLHFIFDAILQERINRRIEEENRFPPRTKP